MHFANSRKCLEVCSVSSWSLTLNWSNLTYLHIVFSGKYVVRIFFGFVGIWFKGLSYHYLFSRFLFIFYFSLDSFLTWIELLDHVFLFLCHLEQHCDNIILFGGIKVYLLGFKSKVLSWMTEVICFVFVSFILEFFEHFLLASFIWHSTHPICWFYCSYEKIKIFRWVYEGVIDDPYSEFFIAENKTLQKVIHLQSNWVN